MDGNDVGGTNVSAEVKREGTGQGPTLDEAVEAAIRDLGWKPRFPDDMLTARLEIYAVRGGIAGFRDYQVRATTDGAV